MSKETELVIFCKIGDFNGLKEASYVEEQEQIEMFVPQKGRMRVRKTTDAEGTRFEACIKSIKKKEGGTQTCDEVETPVTSQYMEAFRKVADSLQIKTRYIFDGTHSILTSDNTQVNLPPIKFEVDVYKRHDGQISNWCKIDIELDEFMKAYQTIDGVGGAPLNITVKITHLPFKPQNAFLVGDCTDEQQKFMEKLWDTDLTQSPMGGPRAPIPTTISAPPASPPQPEVNTPTEADNERTNDQSV